MPAREPDPYFDSFSGPVTFDALHDEPADPAGLAERLDLDPLGAETLTTTLLTLGYLEQDDGSGLRNADVTERLLVASSPESIATFVGAQADLHWEVLDLLPEAVRHGRAYAWSHSRNFRPSEIRGWMEEAGFERVDVHGNERSPWRVVVVGR